MQHLQPNFLLESFCSARPWRPRALTRESQLLAKVSCSASQTTQTTLPTSGADLQSQVMTGKCSPDFVRLNAPVGFQIVFAQSAIALPTPGSRIVALAVTLEFFSDWRVDSPQEPWAVQARLRLSIRVAENGRGFLLAEEPRLVTLARQPRPLSFAVSCAWPGPLCGPVASLRA